MNMNNKQFMEMQNQQYMQNKSIEIALEEARFAIERNNDELRQEGAEAVTAELIERGIL